MIEYDLKRLNRSRRVVEEDNEEEEEEEEGVRENGQQVRNGREATEGTSRI